MSPKTIFLLATVIVVFVAGMSLIMHRVDSKRVATEILLADQIKVTGVANTTLPAQLTTTMRTALLANGCFWCVESDLQKVNGVTDVISGYAGGTSEYPKYENYISGGHREVVLVTYDAEVVSFANLVEHIIKHGDPTDSSGSFNDRGPEYTPAIYYESENERTDALKVIDAINTLKVFPELLPLVVIPRQKFWAAEEYHQDYAIKNPLRYGYYRDGSGRNAFIEKYWGGSATIFEVSDFSAEEKIKTDASTLTVEHWRNFIMPTDAELRTKLTPLQHSVTQEEGTERPFDNAYDKNQYPGIYVDIISSEPLYSSRDKFDSGTGWPSFVKPITKDAVILKEDTNLFTTRVEVRSRIANSHLGHVFNDGPADRGGLRYCMNSAAMRFVPLSEMEKEGYGAFVAFIQ